jgi:hypothetical protein
MSSFTEEATSPTDAKKKKFFSLAKKQFRKYIWKRKYLARGYDLYQE